ncbi:helix-turn-helix transcriptional regulator [Crassaminicella thermophila]|uniref:Helix-turn-helix transcriptional regulator n=1 Tax=Crassaminicella thermophila TaxID=2599308 RepID=A0A5C0SAP6_CRATE|nr:helix-turn-helix transcriptional regulator [Crassaminicella thermophila]QEK11653.1 helix-turn-helix transcriptional regulator [Crassaminicella thermophila]
MFGSRLKHLRSKKKITQQELAELLNVSPSTIGMYEQGRRDPDTNTIKFLANYFNVSTDYLLGIVDDPDVIRVTGDQVPKELRNIGVEYLTLAKEMQDKEIPPEDIKKILDVLKKHT